MKRKPKILNKTPIFREISMNFKPKDHCIRNFLMKMQDNFLKTLTNFMIKKQEGIYKKVTKNIRKLSQIILIK